MKFKKEKVGHQIKLQQLKGGRSLDLTTAQHLTITKEFLSYLVLEGDFDVFKAAYEVQGRNFEWKAAENSLLYAAIDHDKAEFVEYILEEVKNKDEASLKTFITAKRSPKDPTLPFPLESPLMVAAAKGNQAIVQLLVKYGANDPASNVSRKSTIHVIDHFLLEDEKKGHRRGKREYPVYRAIANNHQEIVSYFLDLNKNRPSFVLTNLLLESIHYGRLDLYQFLLQKGAQLPKKITRKINQNNELELSPPTPFSIFLTSTSLERGLNEVQQKELASVFYEVSGPNISLSEKVIESAFYIHHEQPYILWYAIEKFLNSVNENDKNKFLRTFLSFAITNLSDNSIFTAIKSINEGILIYTSSNSKLMISSILKKQLSDYDKKNYEERIHLKRVLNFMLDWINTFSSTFSSFISHPHPFWRKSREEAIKTTITFFQTLLKNGQKKIEEIDEREASIDMTEISLKIIQ